MISTTHVTPRAAIGDQHERGIISLRKNILITTVDMSFSSSIGLVIFVVLETEPLNPRLMTPETKLSI